jgi:hypothetical protein
VLELRHIATNDVYTYSWLKSANLSQHTERYDKFALILDADFPTGQYRYTAFESTTSVKSGSVSVVENGLAAVRYAPQNVEQWENGFDYVEFGGTTPAPAAAVAPVIQPAAGTYGGFFTLTLTSATVGANIYYTTDGSIPTSQNGTLYDPLNPPVVTSSATVRARAYADGLTFSSVTSSVFTVIPITVEAIPEGDTYLIGTLDPIVLVSNDEQALIYYTTNGADPTQSSTQFTAAIPAFSVITTLKFRAFDAPAAPSAIVTEIYNIQALAPVVSTNSGTFTSTVTPIVTNPNAFGTIEQSVNGGAFTTYTGAEVDVTSTIIYRIVAAGVYVTSATVTRVYTIQVATPVISPNGGTFVTSQEVTLTCATSGADIRYTTDGTNPTSSSTLYNPASKPSLTATTDFRARAFKTGCTDSAVASATFTAVARVWLMGNSTGGGGNGRLYRSINKGAAWNEIEPAGAGTFDWLRSAQADFGSFGYVTAGNRIFRLTANATVFNELTIPNANNVVSLMSCAKDNGTMVIYTDPTTSPTVRNIFKTDANGANLAEFTVNGYTVSKAFNGVRISRNATRYALGGDQRTSVAAAQRVPVLISGDSGATWTTPFVSTSNLAGLVAASADLENMIFIVLNSAGSFVSVQLTQNFGTSFTSPAGITNSNYIYASNADMSYLFRGLVGGTQFQFSTNKGTSFTTVAISGISGDILTISCNETGDEVTVTTSNRAYVSLNFGATWAQTQPAGAGNRNWTLNNIQ